MDKPLVFRDLSSLIKDYISCYENYSHKIVKVKIGGAAPTDMCSQAKVWNKKKLKSEQPSESFKSNVMSNLITTSGARSEISCGQDIQTSFSGSMVSS